MEKKYLNTKENFKRLLTYMKPYKKGLYVTIILIVLSSFFNSLGPYVLGLATDALGTMMTHQIPMQESVQKFIMILVLLSMIYLLYAGFKYYSIRLMVRISQKTMYDIRNLINEKLVKLPLNYYDTNTYGDILSRTTNDIDTISNSLQQSIDQIITAITSLIFIFIMMLYISPVLTLIGVFTVPIALFISMRIAKSSQVFFKAQQDTLGDVSGYIEEMYTGHILISAFGKESDSIETFENINDELYDSGWKSQFLTSTLMPITQAMTNLGYVGVAVISGILVVNGKMSIGMIQSFIQYLRQFSQPINQTVQISNILQSTSAAAARVFEFLDEVELSEEAKHPQYPEEIKGNVRFDHVKFGYTPYKYLMHDVNLHVKAGSKVAIVGPTGAGKTTLVNLLLRFYDTSSGSILIDGVDIKNMERKKLRHIFGMVLQDSWLFTGTIMENIRYGRLDATDEEVIQAAKAAHADQFIRLLPNEYDMELQEGALNLAQGERQLLTIARAILADSPIMILDEATSSVDTRTEVLIQEAMINLMKGRTSFVIAHRLSTIKDADMILYMEAGDIKETGTHEELIERKGLYEKLYNSQFEKTA